MEIFRGSFCQETHSIAQMFCLTVFTMETSFEFGTEARQQLHIVA